MIRHFQFQSLDIGTSILQVSSAARDSELGLKSGDDHVIIV